MLRNAKTGFLRCIGYRSFIKDRIKLGSLQILAFVQLQNFQNYRPLVSLPSKLKSKKYYETVYERSGKNMFWPIKNSGEVLCKLKYIGYQATSLSTYDFSTLYTTLPHNLIKEKLLDLIKRTFKKRKVSYTLLVMIRKRFSLRQTIIEEITFGLVRMYVTPNRFSLGQYLY